MAGDAVSLFSCRARIPYQEADIGRAAVRPLLAGVVLFLIPACAVAQSAERPANHLILPKAYDSRLPENRSQAAVLPRHHHGCRMKTGFLVGAAIGATTAAVGVKSSRGFWIPYGALMTGGIGAFICWTDR